MKIVKDEVELRKPCTKVALYEMKELIKSMPNIANTMIENKGVGLASVQVGIHKTFFIAIVNEKIKLFINPLIVSYSDETTVNNEGCLSFPGIYKDIKRSNSIKIRHFDYRLKKMVTETYSGFDARVIQHEYDHLQGIICILDKAV